MTGFLDIDTFMEQPINMKADVELGQNTLIAVEQGVLDKQHDNPIFKQIVPEFLYKPPFGFPRNINVPFLRDLAKNPYIMSIIKTIQEEVTGTNWDIVPKEGIEILSEEDEKERLAIKEFLNNPNDDDESFEMLLKKVILDLIVLDSGCLIKIFNPFGELIQLRTIDGGTIVKNPDAHGRIGGREKLILNANQLYVENRDKFAKQAVEMFRSAYGDKAAYFQFSNTLQSSLPIPFGKDEIVYMMMNPSSENCYSFSSPVQASVDIALSLIFGAKYNLDFYMNSNTPEGIIQAAGADSRQIEALKSRIDNSMYTDKDEYGIARRIGYRLPITNAAAVSFVPLQFSSREMEIIAQQEWFTKLLWMQFGVTASEMGFTKDASKTTDENQTDVAAKKAKRPFLKTIEYYINTQILPEFKGGLKFKFKFDEYDISAEMKKRTLQQQEINMGIKTWQMIAEEEGIDINKLKSNKQENVDFENSNMPKNPMFDNKQKNKVEGKSMDMELVANQIISDIEKDVEVLINGTNSKQR